MCMYMFTYSDIQNAECWSPGDSPGGGIQTTTRPGNSEKKNIEHVCIYIYICICIERRGNKIDEHNTDHDSSGDDGDDDACRGTSLPQQRNTCPHPPVPAAAAEPTEEYMFMILM